MGFWDKIRPIRKADATREGDRTPLEHLFWRSIALVGGFSMVINMLNMVIPIYSMQVFDRVLSSRSVDTLALLTLGIGIVLIFIAAMEQLRSRLLIRVGTALDLRLGGELFAHVVRHAARGSQMRQRPLRDLYGLRGFLTGSGPFALIDFLWAPVYIGVVFVFDYRLGMVACGGAVILILIAIANEAASKISVDRSEESQNRGIAQEETYVRNAEAMEAMGMTPAARQRWQADQSDALYWEGKASCRVGTSTTLSHFVRLAMQVCFIGVGAYLVLSESITIGIMVASMILGMRGLAPFDGAVGAWRSWNAARHSFERLNKILLDQPVSVRAPLPRGQGMAVSVDRLVFAPPGSRNVLFKGFSFKVGPGQVISVAGHNGVGKTALLKLIMGIWVPGSGSVKLDDIEASRIARGQIGGQIGYLAQNPFLFPGTIAENIARLGNAEMRDIVQAAELAGAHQFILDLPDGYETRVDRGGRNLSGGQRQLISLAAALFGRPRLLMLDEPTTALDADGMKRIGSLIDVVRKAGITTIIVSHEHAVLSRADAILVLANGQIKVVPGRGKQQAAARNVTSSVTQEGAKHKPVPMGMSSLKAAGETSAMPPSDGRMRITPKKIAVPNPDAPRSIVEKNSAKPAVRPSAMDKQKMEPHSSSNDAIMTAQPVREKIENITKETSRKTETGQSTAKNMRVKKPLSDNLTVRENARQTATTKKRANAIELREAREAAARRMREFREDLERAEVERVAEKVSRPSEAKRSSRPQLRVVDGSARLRQGGA